MRFNLRPFDFIEQVKLRDTVEGVVSDLSGEAARIGVESLILCSLPAPSEPFASHILGRVCSDEWMRLYLDRAYFADDPVARWASRSTEPFRWTEIPGALRRTRKGGRILRMAGEFGLVDGLVVPMFSSRDWQAAVAFALPRPLDASPDDLAALHLMAIYAANRARRLTGRLGAASALSSREAECLTWIAAGKTVDDIAAILGLSRLTIQTHLRNVRRKLNAATIAQAVAEGIRSGDVRI